MALEADHGSTAIKRGATGGPGCVSAAVPMRAERHRSCHHRHEAVVTIPLPVETAVNPISLSATTRPNRALHISLWAAQLVLAAVFFNAGKLKATATVAEIAEYMPWAADMPVLVRFIGISELVGAVGLVLPALLRIKPALTALAAAGLVVVMILAALFHTTRGEMPAVPINVALGVLAAFVAWGRWRKAPITPR